jgi:hypothetical protein
VTTVINDKEILKTNQLGGKSVSASTNSNQPERPRMDNSQIHPTSPIFSPPHSPEPYKLDDPMDIDDDHSFQKSTDSVINDSDVPKDPHLSTMQQQETKEIKLLSFFATGGSLKRTQLEIDGDDGKKPVKEDDNKRQRVCHGPSSPRRVGVGASTLASRKLNQKVNDGTFKLNLSRWQNFKEKISFFDKSASFPDPHSAPRSVRHSKCGRIVQMKEPYNIANFESHLKTCKSNKTAGMPTLESLFNKQPKIHERTTVPSESLPNCCPGLTETDHPEIPKYLKRSPASGGGAPSLDTIASQLWKKKFSELSLVKQQKAWSSQRAQLRWYNDAEFGRVFSSACMKFSHLLKPQKPCDQCRALLIDKRFRQALSIPIPTPENVRFTPKHWINKKAIELWGDIHGIKPLVEAYDKVWLFM